MDINNFYEIIDFGKFLKKKISYFDSYLKGKKIMFKDIILLCLFTNGINISFSLANIELFLLTNLDVSTYYLIKTKNKLNHILFQYLRNFILDYIYQTKEPRLIGVDGTWIALSKNLKNDGFN